MEGTLRISETLTLTVSEYRTSIKHPCSRRDDDCEPRVKTEVTQQFLPDSYAAKLRIDPKESLRLSLAESSNAQTLIDLELPEHTRIPDQQGMFNLTATEVGQPYDVAGTVNTTRRRSAIYSTWESCSYLVKRLSCYDNHCKYTYVPIYGHRPVEYHREDETKTIVLDLLATESNENLARFDGETTRASKIYDYTGYCH